MTDVVRMIAMVGALAGRNAQGSGAGAPSPAERREGAARLYTALVDRYMHAEWSRLDDLLEQAPTHRRYLPYAQQQDVEYIRAARKLHRPAWWPQTKSRRPTRFQAWIWTREFTANYYPTSLLGMQAVVGKDDQTGKLKILVTWDPRRVDDPRTRRKGFLAAHRMTEGSFGESIVWHELGHNYVSEALPADQVMTLFEHHRELFAVLQEFYADITALYHCSPQGRKATFLVRVPGLLKNNPRDPHVRAAHGIGAFLLARVLMEPEKWPSFRLPKRLPPKDPERYAILHMYTRLAPSYTLAEDRALRNLFGRFLRSRGASVLKSGGTVTLPNRLLWKALPDEDAAHQARRDAWVRDRTAKGVQAGVIR